MGSASDSAAVAQTQQHLLIVQDGQGSRTILLEAAKYSLGRDPLTDIPLNSEFVSRQHALLLRLPTEAGQYRYRILDGDLEGRPSANGLKVNQEQVSSHDLGHGDRVILGPNVELTYFVLSGESKLEVSRISEGTVVASTHLAKQAQDQAPSLPVQTALSAQPAASLWQQLWQWLRRS
ncbi:FHA domain-containing protein [Leptolyngbya sp. FACHB-261]|uniref:FHA domain-containing protein n=1 Tax=Leptolyngbya sp. FACHB-261 TaxID=2692806 RepID=UPI00168328BB|nr:FHA domain-containing protein [Leptolyngbya sp. FACHB-261]MBD2105141.1 FHA domain-containing protein [Leptolyngbya sp. FACHB-261]